MTSSEWQNWFAQHLESSRAAEVRRKWADSPPLVFRSWLIENPERIVDAKRFLKTCETLIRNEAESISLFKKWRALIFDALPSAPTRSPAEREEILRELLRNRDRITVEDYLDALGPSVSRRVAQLDLQTFPFLKKRGKTQARFYVRAPAPRGLRRF